MAPPMRDAAVSDGGNTAIATLGLTKSFGSHHALRGIDINIARRERLVIFGPNGAGKTTFIKILGTLSRPSSGSATVAGLDTRQDAAEIRRRIGIVSHHTFLYNDLTLRENLRFYGRMFDVDDLEAKVDRVADYVALRDRLDDKIGTLSRGLQQRASIARAILHDPSIMLLDEPEVGLDAEALGLMRNILDSITGRGGTVVVTTHNLERGLDISTRVAVLSRGKIIYEAPKSDIDTAGFPDTYSRLTGSVP